MPYPNEEAWQARLADNAAPGKPDLSLVAELNGDVVGSAGSARPGWMRRASRCAAAT